MPITLGELLLKENMVSPQQLEEALNHQRTSGGKLGKALVSLGFVKDEEITKLLSRHYGVPSIDLDDFEVDPAIIKIIPAETARKYQVLPLSLSGETRKTLTIAMADPTNMFAIDDIKFMTNCWVAPKVASETALEESIERYYGSVGPDKPKAEDRAGGALAGTSRSLKEALHRPPLTAADLDGIGRLSEIDLTSLAESADAAPLIKLANVLLVDSLKRGASDIHIEPYEKEFRVRFRIDGVLHNMMALPLKLKDPLTSRIKVMAGLNIAEKRLLQGGRIRIKFRVEDRSRGVDFRVFVLPTLWGETIVMRLLDKSNVMLDMTRLGFEPPALEQFKNAVSKPHGMVLITGPTGSGKTNTLYSAMVALNRPDRNIMTAEGRVEFDLPGINQVQIREDIGLSFAAVLDSFAALDPNVVVVDEICDNEVAEIAVKVAAVSGFLVLAGMTDTDAPSAVEALTKASRQPFMLGRALSLVVAQRLVRRICAQCKVDITGEVPSRTLMDIGFKGDEIGSFQVFKSKGCGQCNGTGYRGQVGLFEVMEISEGMRDLIKAGATAAEIEKRALEEGMFTLRMSGLEKVKQGITTIEELLRETVG